MGVTIIKQTSINNTTWYANRPIKYIVIHYTAGVYSYKGVARNCASMFSDANFEASADFIVDSEEIVQFNGDIANRYCWSVGGSNLGTKGGSFYGKCTNANSISIEMCCDNSSGKITWANDPRFTLNSNVVNNTIKLVKHLMSEYGIPASNVIRHYDVTGKLCPGVIGWNEDSGDVSKWQEFKKKITGSTSSTTSETKETKETKTKGSLKPPYIIRTQNTLAIYNKPDLGGTIIAKCPVGSYTIVEEKTVKGKKFGKLKAGGWVVVTTCKKISLSEAGVAVSKPTTKPKKKTTDELAKDIIAGKYGSGEARFVKLANEGYTDAEVDAAQKKVNALLSGGTVKPYKKTDRELAYAILRGEYGCGDARFKKLESEGYTEVEINAAQTLVNELLK